MFIWELIADLTSVKNPNSLPRCVELWMNWQFDTWPTVLLPLHLSTTVRLSTSMVISGGFSLYLMWPLAGCFFQLLKLSRPPGRQCGLFQVAFSYFPISNWVTFQQSFLFICSWILTSIYISVCLPGYCITHIRAHLKPRHIQKHNIMHVVITSSCSPSYPHFVNGVKTQRTRSD